MGKNIVDFRHVVLGCDPEFFFKIGNNICGSEKIIPKEGLYDGRVIRDGVQAELNPQPNTCRESLASNIKNCFWAIKSSLDKTKSKIVFDEVVTISKEEMKTLSKESKTFGCAPSLNLYDGEESKIKVNPEIYKYRSAGGHIHLGIYNYVKYGETSIDNWFFTNKIKIGNASVSGISIHELKDFEKCREKVDNLMEALKRSPQSKTTKIKLNYDTEVFMEYEKLIYLLDILVGNTGVLLDRNPLSAERRKVYGRAGEFRLTPYGVEYRVLSNFWLKSYTIFSLMFALARFAVCVLINDKENHNTAFYDAIIEKVNGRLIEEAINENNFDLAMKNYLLIEDIVCKMCDGIDYTFPINNHYKKSFMRLVKKGMPYFFKGDILEHWLRLNDDDGVNARIGWERFAEKEYRLCDIE